MPHSFPYFLFFSILLSLKKPILARNNTETNHYIVAIIDADTRIGKEQKTAIEVAITDFNNSAASKLFLTVENSCGDPFQAVSKAKELITEQNVTAIIGPSTWQETALVADIGNQAKVPVLSFATSAVSLPLTSLRWPYLVRMANNDSVQMKCIAAIVELYEWRRVIAIYEDNGYVGGDSGAVTLLSDELRFIGLEIETRYPFPPLSSLSNPKSVIRNQLVKLKSEQCKVFVVAKMPPPLAAVIFTEAKQLGMMEKGYVWITTDGVTSLLESLNSSVIASMEGVVGIKTYFNESDQYEGFRDKFRRKFQSEYPEEVNHEPSFYALRAYDAVSVAVQNLGTTRSQMLVSGSHLSGEISFEDGELANVPIFRIVNVIGKGYKEVGFWAPKTGFSQKINGSNKALGRVYWPGGLDETPKGWAARAMKIGVPGRSPFPQFVRISDPRPNVTDVSGFSIDVFNEVVKVLPYDLPHKFEIFNGTYDDLVQQVYFKNYDGVVGDTTILANRSRFVEFSQPYVESGLSMLVATKSKGSRKTWLFTKPFTKTLWMVTGAIFVYTGIVVWLLEHPRNPDFRGPWRSQIGILLSFTFSTLFFAHKERIRSNFTRIVIVVWLLVVFVLTSSYTASLTSMLTVEQLEPMVTDIESLKRSNAMVGCDAQSFVCKYLEDVLNFHPRNIKKVYSGTDYPAELSGGKIAAAFLETPSLKLLLGKYCNGYTTTGPTFRSEGYGFAFAKGSPLVDDISKAILTLSENGKLKELEDKLFSSSKCATTGTDIDNSDNLGLDNFWGLFAITGGTSTIILILFISHLILKFRRHREESEGNPSPRDESIWKRTVILARYFDKGQIHPPQKATPPPLVYKGDWCSYVSENHTPEHPQCSPMSIEGP